MNVHKNAGLTPRGRLLMVQRIEHHRWKVADAAAAAGLSVRRTYHWLGRYRAAVPAERVGEIERLRRQRMSGPQIARQLAMPRSTVGVVPRRLGLGRLSNLDPKPPAIRYQRERPGELIHIDTKKLGRIDDASRLAYTEILPDEKKESAIVFLDRALAWFARHGVTVERLMTDNGSAYRSHAFPQHELGKCFRLTGCLH